MGSILQQRLPQQYPVRLCTEPGWKPTTGSDHRPEVDSYNTDTFLLQRRPQHLQDTPTEQTIRTSLPRRMHRSTNRKSKYSSQVTSESPSPVPPTSDQSQVRASVTLYKKKHTNPTRRRHTAAFPCHQALSDSSPDPALRLSVLRESGAHRDDDSDTDLSESEKLSELPCGGPPPQLQLRPEVITLEEPPLCSRHKNKSKFEFPDFLPPPFNSWSLNQLAYFYNMEGRAASQPKPTGQLERYLERLMQLEWYQIKTWQDNNGTTHPEPLAASHKSLVSTSARLSTPKCILQCQRAFPLTILSSVTSHCAYIVCTTRNLSCSCRSSGNHARPSRMSPTQEKRGPSSLPKRSYSESRAPLLNQRLSSPVRNQGHLKQMQAAGNLRSSVHAVYNRQPSTARDQGPLWKDNFPNYRTGFVRSGSVNRKSNSERPHNSAEKRRGRSECRKGHAERRAQQEVKPDAVNAIMDNLSATKSTAVNRLSRSKQIEFIT
ncbi:uncharacterized protein LOC129411077 [Boleophthalmus pectinirostris]|uniref:uncharacterized protein LOC129411077 n=1 Tax=Boleophthalmus pectinirostris TaxID=150288 RepID=UPI00243104AF|nr:uncharacterized protein LOC129411077 [Boleophthalmus pectinirostris]